MYKRTGKWKYHPETGLYMHVKHRVYYAPKDGDPTSFRRIEDDDDPLVKKMEQSEEMRKAIQSTEFVKFDENAAAQMEGADGAAGEPGKTAVVGPEGPPPKPPEEEKIVDFEGKVQKWDSEKGFGFIVTATAKDPANQEKEKQEKSIFVHRKSIVGSTPTNPINLREGGRVKYKLGEQDGRPCALEVMMLDANGKTLAIHADAKTLEEKKKSYYVTSESLGLRVHIESWPGLKKTLQDRYTVDEPLEELGVYFGVFDGHGGTQVADHVASQLHKKILMQFRQKQVQPASREQKIKAAITEAFVATDKEILPVAERKKFEQVGSTAVCAMFHGNPKLGTALRLVVSNLGDSRCVICRAGKAVPLSEDHKPNRLDEKKRIERAGGMILQMRGTWRIATTTNPNATTKAQRKEYQGLAMTRSFGDLYFKQPTALALAEPDITVIPLTDKDLFLVLATDGIFDVLSNQETIDIGLKNWEDPEEAAKQIVRTAYKKGSEDNLTALVIQFGWADKNAPKYVERAKQALASGHNQDDNPGVWVDVDAKVVDDGIDDMFA